MPKQRKIIHIDMDCFYAAIEIRDNPALSNKPIAVGGSPSRRGVICTSNYIARKYGVRSAMASAYALKLCPSLIILKTDFKKYRTASKAIHQIFHQFTDIIEPLSLDEAFLDVTNNSEFQGSATLIAQEIRHLIFQQQKLTASAGIAPNKFLAKIASDWQKPNGQFVITPDQVTSFVKTLPVEKIFGVGKVTAKKLKKLNIKTCGDLQKLSVVQLSTHFGSFGERLYELCRGIDDRPVEPHRIRKSVSVEHTYDKDLSDLTDCLNKLPTLFAELKERLQKHNDRKIDKQFVKIKFHDFQLTTAECKSTELNINTYELLFRESYKRQQKPVRLLGIGVHFKEAKNYSVQLELSY